MTTPASLKRKLKASDKRRRRRAIGSPGPAPAARSATQLDLTGMLVHAILDVADADQELSDAAAVAALRACLTGLQPSGVQSRALFARLQQIATRDDVSPRAARTAIEGLLDLASAQHKSETGADRFLSYLTVLCNN